jgi:hypothetical protein
MGFDREEILKSVIENLASGADLRFGAESNRVEQDHISRGMTRYTGTIQLVAQAFRDEVENRVFKIAPEIERVLEGAQIKDFGEVEKFALDHFARLKANLADIAEQRLRGLSMRLGFSDTPLNFDELIQGLDARTTPEIKLIIARLRDSQPVRLSLQPGEVFAANRALRSMFNSAKSQLDILDNFFGPEVLDMLEVTAPNVQIRLLSRSCDRSTRQAYLAFKQQYPRIEFRTAPGAGFHDRYVIVDSQQSITIGHSIKDLGTKMSEITELPAGARINDFNQHWASATPVV